MGRNHRSIRQGPGLGLPDANDLIRLKVDFGLGLAVNGEQSIAGDLVEVEALVFSVDGKRAECHRGMVTVRRRRRPVVV